MVTKLVNFSFPVLGHLILFMYFNNGPLSCEFPSMSKIMISKNGGNKARDHKTSTGPYPRTIIDEG